MITDSGISMSWWKETVRSRDLEEGQRSTAGLSDFERDVAA
jgi:hypothetical protein